MKRNALASCFIPHLLEQLFNLRYTNRRPHSALYFHMQIIDRHAVSTGSLF